MPRTYGHGKRISIANVSRSARHACVDRFGYMFPGLARRRRCQLPADQAVRADLIALGEEIAAKPGDTDNPNISAGYTYWGQFIDHDITFDPFSDIDAVQNANTVQNMRTPSLDLDCVYGRGPGVDPALFDQANPGKMLLGTNTSQGPGGPNPGETKTDFDVPRNSQGTAIIGDPRNDENLIVSQLQHAFLRFHNAVVDQQGTGDFAAARESVVHHYQWAVANDFLKTITGRPALVDNTIANGPRFFRRRPFRMPVEFAVAAYRFGHSMIRDNYDINQNFINEPLDQIFRFVRPPLVPVLSNWVVDFNRFFDTGSGVTVNASKSIDSNLAVGLNSLPGQVIAKMKRLGGRNLERSVALGVPTGQCVARRMGIRRLTPAELLQGASPTEAQLLQKSNSRLIKKTPLWYYILKESEVKENGERLGRVGARIVVDVFARMLHESSTSYIHSGFTPTLPRHGGAPAGDFTMVDLLSFAAVLS